MAPETAAVNAYAQGDTKGIGAVLRSYSRDLCLSTHSPWAV